MRKFIVTFFAIIDEAQIPPASSTLQLKKTTVKGNSEIKIKKIQKHKVLETKRTTIYV